MRDGKQTIYISVLAKGIPVALYVYQDSSPYIQSSPHSSALPQSKAFP
jgi:hypothetical protein